MSLKHTDQEIKNNLKILAHAQYCKLNSINLISKESFLQGSETIETRLLRDERGSHHVNYRQGWFSEQVVDWLSPQPLCYIYDKGGG